MNWLKYGWLQFCGAVVILPSRTRPLGGNTEKTLTQAGRSTDVDEACTTVADTGEKQGEGEAGVKHWWWRRDTGWSSRQMEEKNKTKHSNKHFLYLSTSESEESLSSDLEAEEEQDREGRDEERKGLTTLKERQGYWKDVTGNEFKSWANR